MCKPLIGFIVDHWMSIEGRNWFHTGYAGCGTDDYKRFYEWLRTVNILGGWDDMPHDFFCLSEADAEHLKANWVWKATPFNSGEPWSDEDRIFKPRDPSKPRTIEEEIFDLLHEEIQREINAEALAKLRSPPETAHDRP